MALSFSIACAMYVGAALIMQQQLSPMPVGEYFQEDLLKDDCVSFLYL
jgi:hypothetical protein